MRWDDLQILKLIDELEGGQQLAELSKGLNLMDRAAQGQIIDSNRESTPFARELLMAREAGFLTWTERSIGNLGIPDPLSNSHYWLQEIWDLRLTTAGRDRARGRVIMRPLPDPDEDDERPIAGLTLEEIARAIGDVYTPGQLPKYLRDSGIPEQLIPPSVTGNKWEYVLYVLDRLHDGGSATRRVLREFIGSWLEGRHHMAPQPQVRKRIATVLGAQGWHVLDGRLVIGERIYDPVGLLTALGSDVRIAALHIDVRLVADRYLDKGAPEVAIFEAFKAVNNRVKAMAESGLDGNKLMSQVFAETDPTVVLADLSTESGRNIQTGFRFLFMGAASGIRNPDAHEQFKELSPEEALEMLAFASLLMRRLDTASVKQN